MEMLKKLVEVQGKTAQHYHLVREKLCPQSWEWARSIEWMRVLMILVIPRSIRVLQSKQCTCSINYTFNWILTLNKSLLSYMP